VTREVSMRATFTLPGGLLDGSGPRLQAGWLRPLDGFDEEWIHSLPPSTARAAFVTQLLARCVRRIGGRRVTRAVARALTVGDRDFLVLRVYQATFGGVLALVLDCAHPGCGAKMNLDLRIEDIPVEERRPEASYRLRLGAPEPVEIEYRLPRGADEERLASSGPGTPAELRQRLLDACVLSEGRPAWSDEALTAAIEAGTPHVEWEIEVRCPQCDRSFDVELDVVSVLLQEVAQGRRGFDREIHLLAFHYHWPLRELLALTRPRRQRFLRLLMGELEARAS
jgi:hypothetical protein